MKEYRQSKERNIQGDAKYSKFRTSIVVFVCLMKVYRSLQTAPRDNTYSEGVCFVAQFGAISNPWLEQNMKLLKWLCNFLTYVSLFAEPTILCHSQNAMITQHTIVTLDYVLLKKLSVNIELVHNLESTPVYELFSCIRRKWKQSKEEMLFRDVSCAFLLIMTLCRQSLHCINISALLSFPKHILPG